MERASQNLVRNKFPPRTRAYVRIPMSRTHLRVIKRCKNSGLSHDAPGVNQ